MRRLIIAWAVFLIGSNLVAFADTTGDDLGLRVFIQGDSIGKLARRLDRLQVANDRLERDIYSWELVTSKAEADLSLVIREGRVWFLDPMDILKSDGPDRHLSLPYSAEADEVDMILRRFARTHNVVRFASMLDEGSALPGLRVELHVNKTKAPAADGPCAHVRTAEASAIPANSIRIDPVSGTVHDDVHTIGHCDEVYVVVTNGGAHPLDISPFYAAPHRELYFIWGFRNAESEGLRLEPGQTRIVSYTEDTSMSDSGPTPVGEVSLIFFALASEGPLARDLRGLETIPPRSDQETVRGHADRSLIDLIESAGFGSGSVRTGVLDDANGDPPKMAGARVVRLVTKAPGT